MALRNLDGDLDRRRRSLQWNLQRFGLVPSKIARRLTPARDGPRVLCISVPKAGTHLLERALCLHPDLYRKLTRTVHGRNLASHGGADRLVAAIRPGQVVIGHLTHRELYGALHGSQVRSLFMVRDPRDVLVSQAHYIAANRSHHLHEFITSIDDPRKRYQVLIVGDPSHGLPSVAARLDSFAPWLEDADLTIKFEDLIGQSGGGSASLQAATLASIYETLDLDPPGGDVESLGARLFSDASPTFRKGSSGQWRSDLDAELISLYEDVAGPLIQRFGYDLGM